MSNDIAHVVPVTAAGTLAADFVGIYDFVSVIVAGAIFTPPSASVVAPAAPAQRYPAIPAEFLTPDDPVSTTRMLEVLRERVEIFSRDRGRVEDSFVRVEDLILLGLIKTEDLQKLTTR